MVAAIVLWQWLPSRHVVAGANSPGIPAMVADPVEPILPLPDVPGLPPERVALGALLFQDRRLSANQTLSCASCHDFTRGGADGQRVSTGIGGAQGTINAPSVFNSSLSLAQFWDGRALSLEEQAAGPIHNPLEMGSDWKQVLTRLRQDIDLDKAFRRAYPDGLTANNVAHALATYERTLLTPNSRFDRHLKGEQGVLSAEELEGYRRFRSLGCTSCHQGALVGGNMFQKFGVLRDYFAGRAVSEADQGRYNVTRDEEDRHVFKVPSLRNVALTAPYFHDGSAATLAQAVSVMGRYQLGRELSSDDVALIVAFLKTLTGEWQGVVLQ
ncbi:MAG: cytochrome-c peroxidase [Rhodocyclales bacterium GT-UBC]|nr:MAG: cytochrome-c peroxidase [Rhodocyclales bacterium GT-UBC]